MRKRIFIGIPLSDEIIKKIENLEKNIDKHLNWIPLKNLHITILFIGWIDESEVNVVLNTIKDLKFEKFECGIEKLDYSPNRKMIWLYINNGMENLKILHEKTKDLIKKCLPTFKEEEREYLPHINLVRLKHFYKKNLTTFLNWHFIIEKINVYEVFLEKPFARYEVLYSIELK